MKFAFRVLEDEIDDTQTELNGITSSFSIQLGAVTTLLQRLAQATNISLESLQVDAGNFLIVSNVSEFLAISPLSGQVFV